MPVAPERTAIVIGAGIGGLSAAGALKQAGVNVTVYERRSDLSDIQIGGGIVMWANAIHALQELGLADAVIAAGIPVTRAEHRGPDGKLIARWPLAEFRRTHGVPAVSISRAHLHPVLEQALGDTPVHLNAECTGFEQDGTHVEAMFADGSRASADMLICADGRNSALRKQLGQVDEGYPPYAGYTLWSSVAKIDHPGAPQGTFVVMHGRGVQVYFFHINPGEVYWSMAVWMPEGERGRQMDAAFKTELEQRLLGWGEPIPSLLAATQADEVARRAIHGGTPLAHWGDGRVTLLGDAAHPMTTTQGQGAGSSIEDAVVLKRCLANSGDVASSLREYEGLRMTRAQAFMDVSRSLESSAKVDRPVGVWIRNRMMGFVVSTPRLVRRIGWYKEMSRII